MANAGRSGGIAARRADPLETSARELCLAAGQDPDERVANPAKPGRTMPAWTTFRAAARTAGAAEAQAAVQAAIRAAGIVTDQPPQYASAPLVVLGEHEPATVEQMRRCMGVGNVVGGVLCADGHLGYAQPVGGVIAYDGQISISGVGFDIACGNMAVRLDTPFAEIAGRLHDIVRANETRVDHPLFDDDEAWRAADREDYRQRAREQLGTVGGGNHYVDLFRDAAGFVWIGVHFGSRGLGHSTATKYLKAAGGQDGIDVPPAVVDVASELGARYLAAMELAGRYAYAGREWVVEAMRRIIGGDVTDSVHNHHNFAWCEAHGSRDLWVVRKGATPAFPGQRGFVGGSMGDVSVILRGIGGDDLLHSTVHGAGRVMSRKQALRTLSRAGMEARLAERGVLLSGGDLDESPMVYRPLGDVLRAHAGTIEIEQVLSPVAVLMAGDEDDPWKD